MGVGANDRRELVIEMEYRRKSGRGVTDWFVMSREAWLRRTSEKSHPRVPKAFTLLDEHRLYNPPQDAQQESQPAAQIEATFNLELNERQRRERDRVVLPYFDAQRAEGGVAEGGRILYEMGVEDDFDDEEDEI